MTSAPFPLHRSPAAGFDQPFELLAACHERMARTLALLERLGAHLAQHGCDTVARSAASDVLRYFDMAAPLHHQDEELHVLPRLREQGQAALAARLRAEHRVMEHEWAALRPDLVAVQAGTLDIGALGAARARWTSFATLYRGHLGVEDAQAFPAARDALTLDEARTMGQDMAHRRGARYPPLDHDAD